MIFLCAVIFIPRTEVTVRVCNIQNAIFEMCNTWDDAFFVYATAFDEGTLSIEPIPQGRFDKNAAWVPISPPKGLSNTPRQYYIPTPSEIKPPTKFRKLYVVLKGEAVGIFPTWYALRISLI